MCGLYFATGVTERDRPLHDRALARMGHRGPDARESLHVGALGLFAGHARLSLLSGDAGRQPYDDGRFVVLLAGEVYNLDALSRDFGVPFSSETQAIAVILARHGPRGLARLDGMYAIVAYDRLTRRIVAHRDPMGLKQLHMTRHGGRCLLSSEIAPLLVAIGTRGTPDREALIENLLFRVSLRGRTAYRGIERLRPGETRILDGRGRPLDGWIEDVADRCYGERAADAAPDALHDVLRRAALSTAAHRGPSVRDVALLLSSGLDSNALGAIYGGRDRAVSAVTACYSGLDTPQDESALAAAAARRYGLPLRRVAVRADPALLSRALTHLEAPTYSSSALALWTIADRLSREGVKVALVGDGSDELFFGYSQLLHAPDAPPETYQARIGLADAPTVAALTGEPLPALKARIRDALAVPPGVETWRAFQAFELRHRIPDYQAHRLDRLFMAHGIEARVPFLRREVVAWALSVGRDAHLVRGRKSLLAAAMGPHLAPEVRALPKKRFVAPVGRWRSDALARDMRRHAGREALLRLGFRPTLAEDAFARLSDRCTWGLYMMARWADLNWELEPAA